MRILLLIALLLPACESEPEGGVDFGEPGSTSADSGAGSFTFGAATAATQIEDANPHTDWYAWTDPEGLATSEFVGDAVMGYSRVDQDMQLLSDMHLDAYRFSVEWARVEPQRDAVSEEALAHYDAQIDDLVSRGIAPMITLHHFSNPTWVDDPRRQDGCEDGPTDEWLCGWAHPEGSQQILEELAEHARLIGDRYGDRVDNWCTVNEPINYLLASYGIGVFPPGRSLLLFDFEGFMDVVRNYITAHQVIYDALKEADTIDADGDGVAASVGYTLSVAEWTPARDNAFSDDPADIAATERVRYVYHHLFTDSLLNGTFDVDLDGAADEQHPEWAGKLDWLGVQYYSRLTVSSEGLSLPGVRAMICFEGYDMGSCVAPQDPTKWVPTMGYEYFEPGIYNVLTDFSSRWPDLPMTVTESGLATEVGRRRAEHVVRSLEQIARARDEGVDVRGYYHWSLTDNFEWSEGYEPRFGLYRGDHDAYERTATEGATVLGEIAGARRITQEQLDLLGGTGPMTVEE